jgi:hypothetical protein
MKLLDCVQVIVEKEEYAKEGVHKGMYGWMCDDEEKPTSDGRWLINFPQYGPKPDIATICIKEEDLEIVPVMFAIVNERIKAEFGD